MPLFGKYPKDFISFCSHVHCCFIEIHSTIARKWKKLKCPPND